MSVTIFKAIVGKGFLLSGGQLRTNPKVVVYAGSRLMTRMRRGNILSVVVTTRG